MTRNLTNNPIHFKQPVSTVQIPHALLSLCEYVTYMYCYCSRHTMFRLRQTTALVEGFGRQTQKVSLICTRKLRTCSALYQEAKVKVFHELCIVLL